MSETAKLDIADIPPGSGFVMIAPELKRVIRTFLQTRPYSETNHLIETAFAEENLDKMWTDSGFVDFIKLLREMPQGEVKPIIDMIANPVNTTDVQFFMKNAEPLAVEKSEVINKEA